MNSLPQDGLKYQDPSEWPSWTDQIRWELSGFSPDDDNDDFPPTDPDFRPSPSDEREAAFLFGEHASYDQEDRFSEWVNRLPKIRFRSVRRAFSVLRSAITDFQAYEDRPSFEEWLDTLAPDFDRYEAASVIDCHGIYS